jgi:hypothetical protein
MRFPQDLAFALAAERFAARTLEIHELTRQASAVPPCEHAAAAEDETHFPGYADCPDTLEEKYVEDGVSGAVKVVWWEATSEQIATFCVPCQSRVALWKERHRLRRTLGGLKRNMLRAYRAALAAAA